MTTNLGTSGQQFVSVAVHLAGPVEVETGHRAQYSAEHIQARIGGVLVYFLDQAAVTTFATTVGQAAQIGGTVFGQRETPRLPEELVTNRQEISLVVRLQGDQGSDRRARSPTTTPAGAGTCGSPSAACGSSCTTPRRCAGWCTSPTPCPGWRSPCGPL
jgi:hypothetical protein